jgi:hypothetical protein
MAMKDRRTPTWYRTSPNPRSAFAEGGADNCEAESGGSNCHPASPQPFMRHRPAASFGVEPARLAAPAGSRATCNAGRSNAGGLERTVRRGRSGDRLAAKVAHSNVQAFSALTPRAAHVDDENASAVSAHGVQSNSAWP